MPGTKALGVKPLGDGFCPIAFKEPLKNPPHNWRFRFLGSALFFEYTSGKSVCTPRGRRLFPRLIRLLGRLRREDAHINPLPSGGLMAMDGDGVFARVKRRRRFL